MRIGIPKEIKTRETRVALTPAAVAQLVQAGHTLMLQSRVGQASGYSDEQYQQAGAQISRQAADVYQFAELLVKVKEPIGQELEMLQAEQILFSFLHLDALPELTTRLCEIGLSAIGFETLQDHGMLPILQPMSQIAGKLALQLGSCWLHSSDDGKGLLLGGLAGVERGRVVVLGGGNAGGAAAELAARMGTEVTVFDNNPLALQRMQQLGDNVSALFAEPQAINETLAQADLLIGAVLRAGAKAPHLVNEAQIKQMQPGTVVIDIAIDQGGCIETVRPTDYEQPTYRLHDVIHAGITNLPAAVGRSASAALSARLLPYVLNIAAGEWEQNSIIRQAINVQSGRIVHPALQ
ncbi:MAG: alanine dehydrogenase [gamma proteobacterium symbiont of Bathyaustriella thionipta]|nr:alanine dehydrogenase [gamma proteobacterium symbiont of Bathyaustriella thionipta]